MRSLAMAVLSLALACATPALPVDELVVRELAYGRYHGPADSRKHAATTDQVPCELRAAFGTRVALEFEEGRELDLPLKIAIDRDWGPGDRSERTEFPDGPFQVPNEGQVAHLDIVISLDERADLVDSDFTIQFFDPANDHVYTERTFNLRGCR